MNDSSKLFKEFYEPLSSLQNYTIQEIHVLIFLQLGWILKGFLLLLNRVFIAELSSGTWLEHFQLFGKMCFLYEI